MLILCEHKLIQPVDIVCQPFIGAMADILDRFPKAIAALEGHNLIGSVHADFVVDVFADFLHLLLDRRDSTVISPEIINYTMFASVISSASVNICFLPQSCLVSIFHHHPITIFCTVL